MRIREWMKKPVFTIKPRDTVLHARQIMMEYRINQLPVVEGSKVVGIVTDRDVRDAFPSVFDVNPGKHARDQLLGSPEAIPVEEVMSSGVFLLSPDDTVEEAARIMRRERIGSLPIVAEGKLAGILTRSDVLGAFLAVVDGV